MQVKKAVAFTEDIDPKRGYIVCVIGPQIQCGTGVSNNRDFRVITNYRGEGLSNNAIFDSRKFHVKTESVLTDDPGVIPLCNRFLTFSNHVSSLV